MKNIHELLQALGLEIPEDKKADFDKELLQNYKTVADYDKQTAKLQAAEDKVNTTAEALKKFDGVDVSALKTEIENLKGDLGKKDTDYQQKIADMEFDGALASAISTAKGKNPKAIKALFDEETLKSLKSSKNQAEDIKAALESVKKDNDYLFDSDQAPPPYAPGAGGNPPNSKYSPEIASIRAAAGLKTE